MPYLNNAELPAKIKNHLPDKAQDIYRAAFNHAYDQYVLPETRRGTDSREVVAHKVAWSAVEKKYRKNDNGEWVKIIL
jgi:cation transport regulator